MVMEDKVTKADEVDIDDRTVFVRNLPFTVTDAQLEDIFSEIGPVRNCFTIKEKGSQQHRGFGFVQFAVKEDANRTVEVKNGATLQGRKIKVEIAKRRAPLDQRRPLPKPKEGDVEEGRDADNGTATGSGGLASDLQDNSTKKKQVSEDGTAGPPQAGEESKKLKHGNQSAATGPPSTTKKRPREEGQSSESQKPARTVIVGGLENLKMVQSVIAKAKKLGPVEDVRHPLDEAELISRGLAKDGCKQGAAAIVYTSVKAAHLAVASLHKQIQGGGLVWARQLGGEGAKLKKWRLIVRNLPFMLKEQTLRELFSPSGFVWEITIPRKPDNSSKGFAFVGFTCKADAEKAIKAVNGKLVSKRPVAVDWAMAKKEFETAVKSTPKVDINDDDDTASEDESEDEDEDNSDIEVAVEKAGKKLKPHMSSEKPLYQKESSDEEDNTSESDEEEGISESDEDDESDLNMSEEPSAPNASKVTEKDLMQRVLQKVVNSSKTQETVETQPDINPTSASPQGSKLTVKKKEMLPSEVIKESAKKFNRLAEEAMPTVSKEDSLKRTVFVRNLPLDAKVPDMHRQFSAFGEVKSFRLVLHPITKRPKGTAFLEFATEDGALASVTAANATGEDGGLLVGGRKLTLNLAMDRDQAKTVAKQMSKEQDDHDRRHLKLAKEGLIEEGTPAAEGLSKGDLAKRKQVEHEKATKLRSPNFHVSTTRLAVHNIPKDMSEKDLKKLFITAVKSRASKQQPVLKQVKILRDEVNGVPGSGGKSRGAAFVEFAEHQHALVALRVLNNNPETFGAEHRPIIEFAIENSQILRKRAALAEQAKMRLARQGPGGRVEGVRKDVDGSEKKGKRKWEKKPPREKSERKTPVEGNSASENVEVKEGERPAKRKREKKTWKKKHDENVEGSKPNMGSSEAPDSMGPSKQKKPTNKRHKMDEGKNESEVGLEKKGGPKSNKSQPRPARPPQRLQNPGSETIGVQKSPSATAPKLQKGRMEQNKRPMSGKTQPKAHKEPTRRDRKQPQAVDKLDQLVTEYRTKYFNAAPGSTGKGDGNPVVDLKRWFE